MKETTVMRAERFELVGKDGKVYASLGLGAGGKTAQLVFFDTKGQKRAFLGLTEDGAHLFLTDKDMFPCISLTLDDDGPCFHALDEEGKRLRVDEAADNEKQAP
ncbi:MAG: hypothetical protein ACRERD_15325 [Candidatus Binatia bacterium]